MQSLGTEESRIVIEKTGSCSIMLSIDTLASNLNSIKSNKLYLDNTLNYVLKNPYF